MNDEKSGEKSEWPKEDYTTVWLIKDKKPVREVWTTVRATELEKQELFRTKEEAQKAIDAGDFGYA